MWICCGFRSCVPEPMCGPLAWAYTALLVLLVVGFAIHRALRAQRHPVLRLYISLAAPFALVASCLLVGTCDDGAYWHYVVTPCGLVCAALYGEIALAGRRAWAEWRTRGIARLPDVRLLVLRRVHQREADKQ